MSEFDDLDAITKQYVEELDTEIKKCAREISLGNKTTENYAGLFTSYKRLSGFIKVDKSIVDKACENLFQKIQNDIDTRNDIGMTYIWLASIYEYKKDKQKALEAYNIAVEKEPMALVSRAHFKNSVMNDKKGAEEDYKRAIELETDPEMKQIYQHSLETMDMYRNSNKSVILVYAVIAAIVISFIYTIFS